MRVRHLAYGGGRADVPHVSYWTRMPTYFSLDGPVLRCAAPPQPSFVPLLTQTRTGSALNDQYASDARMTLLRGHDVPLAGPGSFLEGMEIQLTDHATIEQLKEEVLRAARQAQATNRPVRVNFDIVGGYQCYRVIFALGYVEDAAAARRDAGGGGGGDVPIIPMLTNTCEVDEWLDLLPEPVAPRASDRSPLFKKMVARLQMAGLTVNQTEEYIMTRAELRSKIRIGVLTTPSYNRVTGQMEAEFFEPKYGTWLTEAAVGGEVEVVELKFSWQKNEPGRLEHELKTVNGVLLTGGGNWIGKEEGSSELSDIAKAVLVVLEEAKNSFSIRGETWPVWATCQSMQFVAVLEARSTTRNGEGRGLYLDHHATPTPMTDGFNNAMHRSQLTFTTAACTTTSRLFGPVLSEMQRAVFADQNAAFYFHQFGIEPQTWCEEGLEESYSLLATSQDLVAGRGGGGGGGGGAGGGGRVFVAAFEGRNGLPIYATQFHPEEPSQVSSEDVRGANRALARNFVLEAWLGNRR